ncbi:MAG: hypothetical protein V1813_03515 [Candidatus Aenigmatarchaeota archaeon]
MRHLLLLLMLFLPVILLSSGCVSSGGSVYGTGMEITALETKLSKVYSGESVGFSMRVKNTGSFDAGGKVTLSIGDWQCQPQDEEDFEPLIAPDEERGTTGGEGTFRWTCTAPQINEGMTVPYEARGDVRYDYRSVTSNSVMLVPTEELIALRDAGQSLPTQLVSASHSPVSVSILVEGPIRMMSEENSIEFPVGITIENTGGGVVDASKVDLKVEGFGGLTGKDCDYSSMHLWRGTSQKITCTMSATNVDSMTEGRIVATLTYGYTVSKTVGIEVAGTSAAFR